MSSSVPHMLIFFHSFRYIAPEQVPVQYGGLSKENDTHFTTVDAVTEVTIKPASKHTIEIPATEVKDQHCILFVLHIFFRKDVFLIFFELFHNLMPGTCSCLGAPSFGLGSELWCRVCSNCRGWIHCNYSKGEEVCFHR